MPKERKIPMRMCAGCGEHREKRELIRIVKSPEGEISVDTTGRKNGRGAYICPDVACLQKLRKSKRLERTFEAPVPDEVYEALEKELSKI